MPSIKKDVYLNEEETDGDNDYNESNIEFLKEVFTIDDFLDCEKTKYLLDQDCEWKSHNFEEDIYDFYTKEVKYCNENLDPYFSNIFCNFNKLLNIVNNYIEPQYNLNIFYENTLLAQPLIDKFDYNNELIKINRKKEIEENYNNICKNKGKLFNWTTKKHI